jgi:protein TonB
MFNNLVESKPKKVRSRGGTIFSFIAHYGLILFVIYTSAQAATQDDGPKQEKVAFVEVKKEEARNRRNRRHRNWWPRRRRRRDSRCSPPGRNPNVLPDIDLTRRVTNEADITGKGAAGGFSTGVEKAPVREDNTYFEFQVEKPVMQAPNSPSPQYPDILRQAGVEGEALVSFVVDTTGRADVASFKVIRTTHELFATAVKNALPRMRFIPAEVGDKKVRQLVQQPFSFAITK